MPASAPSEIQLTTRRNIIRRRSTPPEDFVRAVSAVFSTQLLECSISLDRTAQAMGIGPRSIQLQLSTYGTTFRDLVTTVRMERAMDLLLMKGNSLAAVSDALGYVEPGNFTRVCTHHYGVSPRNYIRRLPV